MSLNDATESTRPRRRRRGAALENAIHDAVVDEVNELGYAASSLEGIAVRAGVGRMSLYRRWPDKPSLVLATVRARLPDAEEPEEGTGPRERLASLLTTMFDSSDRLVTFLERVLIATATAPTAAPLATVIRSEVFAPRVARLARVFADAREVGLIDPAADIELLARTGPALLFQQLLLVGTRPDSDDLRRVVDHLLPPCGPGCRG